jgi:toxin ParE1/3/4
LQLRLTTQARRDLSDIWMYVARGAPDNADKVLDRIDQQFRLMAAYPLIGRIRSDIARDMRSLVVERWLILYRIEQDGIVVSRVIDGARNLSRLAKPRR